MNYIIFDLEINSKAFKSKLPNEIIEIGAVKLDDDLKTLDTFQSFIKPKLYRKLFPIIKRKTSIVQKDINDAESFKTVSSRFKEWIGNEYILCCWGHDDIFNLRLNCEFNRIDTDWLKRNFDIQSHFSKINQLPKGKRFSLENALIELDIPLEDNLHRADVDAKYTAEIFIKTFNSSDFKI